MVRAGFAERLTLAENAASEARARVATRQGGRDSMVQSAEAARNDAAARAGVPTQEVETGGVRDTLMAHLPNSRTEAGADVGEYLSPDEVGVATPPSQWQSLMRGMGKIFEYLCLTAFGTIFGTSLSLLFGAIDFETLTQPDLVQRNVAVLFGFALIGIFIFHIMGRAIEHFVTIAAESCVTEQPARGFWNRPSTYAVLLAATLVIVFVGVEATIERFGIVQAIADSQTSDAGGNKVKIAKALAELAKNEPAYRAISLIAALPFALFHVGAAWRTAKHNAAVARRRAAISTREEAFLERAEVRDLYGAQAALVTARANAATGCAESQLIAEEAERRVADLRGEQAHHPDLTRAQTVDAERDTFFAVHPLLRIAREQRERINREVDAHPEVAAVKSRYDYHDAQADVIKSWLAQNLWEAGSSAAESFIGEAGTVAGNALHTVSENVARTVAPQSFAQSVVGEFVAAVTHGTDSVATPVSLREQAAERRYLAQKERVKTDPTVRYCRDRISSLQARLRHMEDSYKRRITSLKKQRRSVELTPGTKLAPELADAETQILSAQLQFEQEYAKLMRLMELPALIRWWSHLQQVWLRPDAVVVYAETANRARPLPVAIAPKSGDE